MREPDRRDDLTWIVAELTSLGERRAEAGLLDSSLREALGVDDNYPLFIPYVTFVRNGRRSVLNVIEGYVFIGSGLVESLYLSLPNKTPYISNVIHRANPKGLPVLSTVPDVSVKSLKDNLARMISREIEEGARVRVAEGLYIGLVGTVIGFQDEENAFVLIDLRSLKALKTLPKFHLRPMDGLIGFEAPTEVFPAYPDEDSSSISTEEDGDE